MDLAPDEAKAYHLCGPGTTQEECAETTRAEVAVIGVKNRAYPNLSSPILLLT
jgi:hypothetical protein